MSEMEQISGLVWKTERPVYDVIRKSRNFWLLGHEWNFSLQLYFPREKPCYQITLHKLDQGNMPKGLKVTVYISSTGTDCGSSLHQITRSIWCVQTVWLQDVKAADSVLVSETLRGQWTITFIFRSNQPLTLHLLKNEIDLASSQDKCVQACRDIPPDLQSLSSDFRQLLDREIFPDVKLRCGNRNISAHRSILAARSDVFTAMFGNKMAESETGTVDVIDVDSEVLDLLLQYVYSGKVPELSEDTASGLYEAGDKYSIHALKKSCSDWMVRNLTAENCLGYLVVADAHSDEEFKDRVVDFAAGNLKSMKKDVWSKFNEDQGGLAIRVYQKLLASTLAEQA